MLDHTHAGGVGVIGLVMASGGGGVAVQCRCCETSSRTLRVIQSFIRKAASESLRALTARTVTSAQENVQPLASVSF